MVGIKDVTDVIKSTASAVKKLKEIDDKVERNEAVFSIQESLLSAQQMALDSQQSMAALIDEKSALEEEIAALRAFEAEKDRYAMHETRAGGITYLVKEDARNGEPSHHVCANCYQSSVKSVLQLKGLTLECPKCGTVVYNRYRPKARAKFM